MSIESIPLLESEKDQFLDECIYRTAKKFIKPCGKVRRDIYCVLKDRSINPTFCGSCKDVKEQ